MELISRLPEVDSGRTPILFVHGAWHAAWCWDVHFLAHFARHGYPAHAVSLRGHGASPSDKPIRRLRLADYADDVARAAERIGGPPVVVGHSMGGIVTQRYLERHAAPAAVLLASVPPRGAWAITAGVAARHPLAFGRAIGTARLYPVVDNPERARRLLVSDRLTPEEWAPFQACLRDESFLAYLDMLGLGLPRPSRVRAPLLVLGAGGDRIVPAADVRATARAYGAEHHLFPRLSHDVMLDPEWQTVADRILAWLGERGL